MDNINILRPQSLNEYVGQDSLKRKMQISIEACKMRKTNLDHSLFYGPPGLGKTTISLLMAKELGVEMTSQSAPSIEKTGDIVSTLLSINENDILFIDEIHRLKPHIEELLYSAMEDFKVDIVTDTNGERKSFTIDLPKFTLIGATTQPGSLSTPLFDRFGIKHQLEYYTEEELVIILKAHAQKIEFEIPSHALFAVATRSRGTPRLAHKLLSRLFEYTIVKKEPLNSELDVANALTVMTGMDEIGLNESDKKYLKALSRHKTLGINHLATLLNDDRHNIEMFIEPFLLKKELIERTQKGRKITDKGLDQIKKNL